MDLGYKTVSIIIPAYNEELSIENVIHNFYEVLPQAIFCIIDNNSTDCTYKLAVSTLKKLNAKGKVIKEPNRGKANAVAKAFNEIYSDIYILCDADNTYPISNLKPLIDPVLNNEADMVIGDRISNNSYKKVNTRQFHSFGNYLLTTLVNIIFKSSLKDILSGLRVFNQNFVKLLPISSTGFEIESEMTIHALSFDYKILEIPISYKNRVKGSTSKLNTFKDGFKILFYIIKLFKRYRPLLLFFLVFIFFVVSGLVIGIPVIIEYLISQKILRIPSAILASGCFVIAFISFFTGLILDSIYNYHKFNFKLKKQNYINQKSL